ncbi:type II toxin-antitoxin system HicB family antitoxin [Candidatus Gottesmanbacteria bacterium]|nr:type II toxin-antitoxin system HicB family antitoxin [Candidatus Gottesmanbacteria bacterium]
MKTTILSYTVVIRKENKNFVAYVPTLGISDFGVSVDIAKKNVQTAIACHIEGLGKTNTAVPPPDANEFYVSQASILAPPGIRFAF